jgi:hypothetical protein
VKIRTLRCAGAESQACPTYPDELWGSRHPPPIPHPDLHEMEVSTTIEGYVAQYWFKIGPQALSIGAPCSFCVVRDSQASSAKETSWQTETPTPTLTTALGPWRSTLAR